MSKNITIQEGGVAKSLTADKLKTDLVGGGTCNWVPEDETQLITKSVTKNGTYKASRDGAYGYSKVIVNVAGGSVSGKGSDGNTHNYSTDDQGNIVDEVIPDTIEVTTPPTNPYGIYQNGQTITTEGMVVKAYDGDGTEYGTVPNDEITISPTTAVYDPSTDTRGGGEATIEADYAANYNLPLLFYHSAVCQVALSANTWMKETTTSDACAVIWTHQDDVGFIIWMSKNANDVVSLITEYSDGRSVISSMDLTLQTKTLVSNTTVYYNYAGSLGIEGQVFTPSPHVMAGGNAQQIATILFDGNVTPIPAGSRQTITVTWPRPGDGAELTTTFEILVAPGYTPGDSNEL